MSTDRVIAPSGPLARAVLGDLPYMDIPLEQGDEPIEVGVSSSPVPGETCVDGGLIQLPDRTLTPAGMSALVSDAELRIGDGSILRDVHHEGTTAPIETIALGSGAPGGLSLAQAVARARDVRLVHLRRRDFQSSMELARTTLALAGAGCVPELDPTDLDAVSRHLHPSLLQPSGRSTRTPFESDNLEWSFDERRTATVRMARTRPCPDDRWKHLVAQAAATPVDQRAAGDEAAGRRCRGAPSDRSGRTIPRWK